jgi:hypothetical protein
MSAAPAEEFEVEDLDAAGLLEAAAEAELMERRASLRKLELAYRWAVLHPATSETGVATHGGPALGVLPLDESLGGDGTPAVAAFTPETFALKLGMSPAAGARLIGDALALRHRLPMLWQRVRRLEVPAWQARRVAQQTHPLPLAGARWVDDRLAARVDGAAGPIVVDRLVAQAIAQFDPETHQTKEDDARAGWHVTLTHPDAADFAGTSDLTAHGDTATLKDFHDLVNRVAHQLHLDGDTRPLGVRKITAIGLITATARGDATLGLSTTRTGTRTGTIKLYVRVDADDLDTDATGGAALAVARVEKLGAATMAKLRQWVDHSQVVIQPVLNLHRRDAVDQHDPPAWMKELVRLRDRHCIFPRCTRDARSCDLDHQIPYLPLDEGGPPGQTHPDNLACLCRRHHRAKTLGLWRYTRTPEGHYHWHGPHGTTYLVTDGGTHAVRAC